MKKKAVCMLLGVLLTGTLLTGCGKNKATEAASESAQTEKEGTGEKTADSAEDDQKKTDETADTKTDKKAEKGTDAEETGEDASETEENREKIAVLLPDEQNWTRDAKELEVQFEEDGTHITKLILLCMPLQRLQVLHIIYKLSFLSATTHPFAVIFHYQGVSHHGIQTIRGFCCRC